jgi:hypothetical protein
MQRELDKLTAQGATMGTSRNDVQRTATRLAVSVSVVGEHALAMTELSVIPAADNLGAKATLDGKPVDLFVPQDVSADEHAIEVTAPGYFPFRTKRRAIEGVSDVVEAELRPMPAHLAIDTEDGTHVAIDGKPGAAVQDVPAGAHTITLAHRGRVTVTREITVDRGETKHLAVDLDKTTARRAVPWLLAGACGFAVLAGIATAGALSNDHAASDLDARRMMTGWSEDQLHRYQTDLDHRSTFRSSAFVLGGASVVSALVGGILYWTF